MKSLCGCIAKTVKKIIYLLRYMIGLPCWISSSCNDRLKLLNIGEWDEPKMPFQIRHFVEKKLLLWKVRILYLYDYYFYAMKMIYFQRNE